MISFVSRVVAACRSGVQQRIVAFLAAVGCTFLTVQPVLAQIRPLAIQGGTILTGDGTTIEGGTILVQGEKIAAVGSDVGVSLLARKVPATGKTITPGFIDAYTTLALRYAHSGDQAPARAADAFDRYADDEIEAALREGITTVYVPARCGNGIGGRGAIIRLNPTGDPESLTLEDEAALSAAIAPNGQGPLARVKVAQDIRKRFQAARDYRQAWEDYEESLEEYEKKLAERADQDGSDADAKKSPPKKRGKKKGTAPSDRNKPDQDDPAKPDGKKDDKKKEELKKPAEPKRDRNAEELLRVLDGDLRLRVEAHHPSDILNLLEIAEEFNIALILEGGTGAHLVADRLAELDVPVVLWAEPAPVLYVGDVRRLARADDAAVLGRAGVEVCLGSGVLPGQLAMPRLSLRASRAVGYGFDADAALQAITSGAASLLGVDQRIGRVRVGLEADLVIWSDHPFAPGARVERVYIAGEEVFNAETEQKGNHE